MNITLLGKQRKDGKYKVRTVYQGAPNMFGGRDPAKVYTSILTPQQVRDLLASPALEAVNWNGYDDARKQLSAAEAKKEKTLAQRLNFHLQFAGLMASVGRDEKRDEHYVNAQELAQQLVDAGH
jgi:hypothetical protein|tara:strand:- start:192 stop:563 length:372 start_codon:yes stop_codon:yes gene_type:complete